MREPRMLLIEFFPLAFFGRKRVQILKEPVELLNPGGTNIRP